MKRQINPSAVHSQKLRLENKFKHFKILTDEIYHNIKHEIASDNIIDKLLIKGQVLVANDTIHHQEPETFTKEKLIERLLDFLGYNIDSLRREIGLKVRDERNRDADYKILVRTQFVLLEAEPINKDLESYGSGISQVRDWLTSRFSETEYGIATDGFKWILLKVSQTTKNIPKIFEVDLLPFFSMHIMPHMNNTDDNLKQLFEKFYFYFSSETILDALAGETSETLQKQSIITDLFYRKYIKYIFGIDRGNKLTNCLVNKITNSNRNIRDQDRRLFSVITMNRLIFSKFLQDKTIIPKTLLNDLIDEYRKSRNNPTSFYQTYLKPLFYDIFSKPAHLRKQPKGSIIFNSVPYLNGGLFTESIPYEKDFDIENDILFEIIGKDFLSGFNLTYSERGNTDSINPDILGRVFEKTINYITSKSKLKKEQGAYYTPTEITNYLCEKSIKRFLFSKTILKLEELGYTKETVSNLRDYDDILRSLPDDQIVLRELRNVVLNLKILDPACGSGHFLKDAGDILQRINTVFMSKQRQEHSIYHTLKTIIINNLYGVDIDANAVEIAKLRLWMALIDSAAENQKLESLPNIEYNIRHGNSLVGLIKKPDSATLSEYVELSIDDKIELLKSNYSDTAEQIRELSYLPNITNMTRIKEILIDIYKKESIPELRNILKVLIDQILQIIQKRGSEIYIGYVLDKIGHAGLKDFGQKLISFHPFHWIIEFSDILNGGGFDVIIENPPYEVLSPKDREFFENYYTGFRNLEKSKQNIIKERLLLNARISYCMKEED